MRLRAAGTTHPGRVRATNQDAFVCDPGRGLFAVIDGMGGERSGEVAAALARGAILECCDPCGDPVAAVQEANRRIVARGGANPAERGMGCVLTVAQVHDGRVRIAHVGDTRALLASAAGTEQLTAEHTAAAQQEERLGLAAGDEDRHKVTRDVGGAPHEDADWIDALAIPFDEGDVLLLASDGVHGLVPEAELFGVLAEARRARTAPDVVAERLVALALERGGTDNATAVVVRHGGERLLSRKGIVSALAGLFVGAALGLVAGALLHAAADPRERAGADTGAAR